MQINKRLFVLLLLATTACSSSQSDQPSVDPGTPVANVPISGEVSGSSFVGKIAVSSLSETAGKRNIYLWEADATCDSKSDVSRRRLLIRDVPWNAGFVGPVDQRSASFLVTTEVKQDGVPVVDEENVQSGRIEVIDAPTTIGASGKVRIRAKSKNHNVEGEVTVLIC